MFTDAWLASAPMDEITRKQFLKAAAVAAGAVALAGAGATLASGASAGGDELQPVDGLRAVRQAVDRYPVVGLGDAHMNEQFHAFLRSVVRCPAVRSRIDVIVVEFGNGLYQDISDRYFLNLEPVGFDELARMWRNTIGGRTYWDAPVYERFYRTVREVNESLPRRHRIRVLLGDVDIDWAEIRSVADADKLPGEDDRETYFYGVVEREVLAKGRRALFVCGGGHLRRGIHTTTTSDMDPPHDPNQPTAGTLLAANHPGKYYVIIPFAEANGANHTLPP